VCYLAPLKRASATVQVSSQPPSGRAMTANVALPAPGTPAAAGLVVKAVRLLHGAQSLRSDVLLLARGSQQVRATTIMQAPNRIQIDVAGGAQSRVIGSTEWDRATPTASWTHKRRRLVRMPNTSWASGLAAASVLAQTPTRTVVTAGQRRNGRLMVWVLTIDRRSGWVVRARLIAPGLERIERYHDVNTAPAVLPPSG
jgi:hypothetical protein